MNEDTLPDPTGPMIQIRSPGWASNIILFRENNPFYMNKRMDKIWNEKEIIFTCSHSAFCKLHSTLGYLCVKSWSMFFSSLLALEVIWLPLDKICLSEIDESRWSLWDSSNKRNVCKKNSFDIHSIFRKGHKTNLNAFNSCQVIYKIAYTSTKFQKRIF